MNKKQHETDIIKILEVLLLTTYNVILILVCCVCKHSRYCVVFQLCSCSRCLPTVFLFSMSSNCVPVLADVFWSSNFSYWYIDDVLSLEKSRFGDYVDHIYPTKFEKRIPQTQLAALHTLTYNSELTVWSIVKKIIRQYRWYECFYEEPSIYFSTIPSQIDWPISGF
jgi:hypothetical protein